jgi:hypothetical protein
MCTKIDYAKKQELLLVLQRPETPLHNNSSETCARAAKIKQTCLNLGIKFMSFLQDRVHGQYAIPRLAIIIRERALAAATDPPLNFFLCLYQILMKLCYNLAVSNSLGNDCVTSTL